MKNKKMEEIKEFILNEFLQVVENNKVTIHKNEFLFPKRLEELDNNLATVNKNRERNEFLPPSKIEGNFIIQIGSMACTVSKKLITRGFEFTLFKDCMEVTMEINRAFKLWIYRDFTIEIDKLCEAHSEYYYKLLGLRGN